jgi:hypothetical protein
MDVCRVYILDLFPCPRYIGKVTICYFDIRRCALPLDQGSVRIRQNKIQA